MASIYDDLSPTATATAHNANLIDLIRPILASKSTVSAFRSHLQSSLGLLRLVARRRQELYFARLLPKRDFFDDFATVRTVAVFRQ